MTNISPTLREENKPPKVIYLQIEGDGYPWEGFEEGEVTWSEDKINDKDIEYIKASEVEEIVNKDRFRIFKDISANNHITSKEFYDEYIEEGKEFEYKTNKEQHE